MKKPTGGPAFPTSIEWGTSGGKGFEGDEPGEPGSTTFYSGMTMRDYFAAKALQGFAADPDMGATGSEEIAALAYVWADAMLKEREK